MANTSTVTQVRTNGNALTRRMFAEARDDAFDFINYLATKIAEALAPMLHKPSPIWTDIHGLRQYFPKLTKTQVDRAALLGHVRVIRDERERAGKKRATEYCVADVRKWYDNGKMLEV